MGKGVWAYCFNSFFSSSTVLYGIKRHICTHSAYFVEYLGLVNNVRFHFFFGESYPVDRARGWNISVTKQLGYRGRIHLYKFSYLVKDDKISSKKYLPFQQQKKNLRTIYNILPGRWKNGRHLLQTAGTIDQELDVITQSLLFHKHN